MKYVIDQIEGKYAVCEDEKGKMINIDLDQVPKDAKVGDILVLRKGILVVDNKQTAIRRKEIEDLMDEVWEDE